VSGDKSLRLSKHPFNTVEKCTAIEGGALLSAVEWIGDSLIVAGFLDNSVTVTNIVTSDLLYKLSSPDCIKSIKFSPEMKTLCYFDFEGGVSIWEKDFKQEKALLSAERKIESLEIEPADISDADL
jgi:hypothetical protein